MEWITFQTTKEQGLNFINSLPTQYWRDNKTNFFRKEHNCNLLLKNNGDNSSFIVSSTHDDYTSFIIRHLEIHNIQYESVDKVEDTQGYAFIISKEIDQLYSINLNQEIGESKVETLRGRYLTAHMKRFESKFLLVLQKIAKYDFEFSILIATSYLEELISQAFKESFELSRYDQFEQNTRTSLTLSFKIEFLYAMGFIDEKTMKTLDHIRKIRNHLAHQSVLEESHIQSINSHIENIESICDNGILYRKETISHVTDERLLFLIPVIENLCIAFIGATHFINPLMKLGGVHYANKGYGTGFFYSITSEYVNHRVFSRLSLKFKQLKIKPDISYKDSVRVNF